MKFTNRRTGSLAVVLAGALLIGAGSHFAGSAAGQDPRPIDIDHFMTGLACVESGGRYEAVNKRSGALGKYQFMPRIWRAWSKRYLGDSSAEPTPANQETVARERISDLFDKHQSWRLVAHWWRTGNAPRDEATWSRGSTKYVNRIMRFARLASSSQTRDRVPRRCYPLDAERPPTSLQPDSSGQVVVTGRRVFVRRGPGPEYRAFTVVRRGHRLAELGREQSRSGYPWLQVGLGGGRTGWIFGPLAGQ